MAKEATPAAAGRALLERERHGVLCTAHAQADGWPYGSVVPYAVLDDGDVVVWISDLAEHTKNLAADPRATLLVVDGSVRDRPQTAARAALLVRAARPEGAQAEAARAAYVARFPQTERMPVGGFSFVVLRVERVRWVGGFAQAAWVDRAAWAGAAP